MATGEIDAAEERSLVAGRERALDRVVQAVDHIETNLLDAPSVEEVAAAVGISRTHLQRLFSELVGESVGSYLRRRRLCRSVDLLLATDRRVLDIALELGFQSQEAYTRAFRAQFGVAPAAYRKEGDRFSAHIEPRLTRLRLEHRLAETRIDPRFMRRERETFVGWIEPFIVGMSDGSNVRDVVPKAWRRFEAGSAGTALERDSRFSLTFPAGPERQVRGDEMLVMVGVRVDDVPDRLPDGFEVKRTLASDFAVFRHLGSSDTFAETVMYVLRDWLPESGYDYQYRTPQLRSFGSSADGYDEHWFPIAPLGKGAGPADHL